MPPEPVTEVAVPEEHILDEAALAAATAKKVTARTRPGSLGRLISLIVSVGLAWALAVAVTAWLLGLFLARG